MAVILFFCLCFILNQHIPRSAAQPSPKFECYQFPEQQFPVELNLHSDVYNTKTSYLKAWQFIRQRFNATFPVDNSCSAVYLFFVGRHAIRFPMKKEIAKFEENLPSIQQELVAGGRLSPLVESELKNWRLLTHQSESARVTLSGKLDTALQARHFYLNFPSLLDIATANIEIGVTSKIRSKETAQAFVHQLIKLQVNRSTSSYEETNAQIDQMLKDKFAMPIKDSIIMSHERCKKHRTPEWKAQEKKIFEISQSGPLQSLVAQFANRNGLSANTTFETISTIYQICINEMAILLHSPWCQLFSTNELKVLNYMSDVYEYRRSSNADNRIGCTIMRDLQSKLRSIVQPSGSQPPKATLYFTHKGMISSFVRHLGLFDNFTSHFLDDQRLCVPSDRTWRSSNVLPYGANVAAVLYKCDRQQFKLLTLLNEVPVKISGCSSTFCDLSELFGHLEKAPCKVDEICPL